MTPTEFLLAKTKEGEAAVQVDVDLEAIAPCACDGCERPATWTATTHPCGCACAIRCEAHMLVASQWRLVECCGFPCPETKWRPL